MTRTEAKVIQLLKAHPLTAQEVATQTNLNPNYIRTVLRHMVGKGQLTSTTILGCYKYQVRPTTADEMSRRREVYAKFGTIPILI